MTEVSIEEINGLTVNWSSSENIDCDKEIQSVITSPPYWDLKDYGSEDQIGAEDGSYEEYQDRLTSVWEECYKSLREDGSIWIVVDTVMERGDLKLLPHDITERCSEIGFHFQDMIVWYKPTAIAGMSERNVVNKKEYIICMSKGEEPYLNEGSVDDCADSMYSDEDNLGNLWRFPVKRGTSGQNVLHKAPYPKKLIDRIINISTSEGDAVLDPFLGSGTTACSALTLGRECVGYEINEEFEEIVTERVVSELRESKTSQPSLSDF
jgi:site-specific DNA-methyltransferase (adenine-specific)